jgi:hypothetical protein
LRPAAWGFFVQKFMIELIVRTQWEVALLETIRELLHREPFAPFRVVLTSGSSYDVTNPDLVALGQSQITLYAPKSDRWSILRLNQIAAVDVLSQAA